MKIFVCNICGYVHEGDTPPAKCPQCGQPAEKFEEVKDNELCWATEHVIGVTKNSVDEMIKDLNAHFMAEDEARHGQGFQGLFNRYFKK